MFGHLKHRGRLTREASSQQVRAFVEGSAPADYEPGDQAARYAFAQKTAAKFDCHLLGRADRGCARAYIGRTSARCGFSPAQTSRLLKQHAETGAVEARRAHKAPAPNGRPGFLRVDTVHLGDRDRRKGVCVVNVVPSRTRVPIL